MGVPSIYGWEINHGWYATVTWCEGGIEVMQSERRTSGLRLYNLIRRSDFKGPLLRFGSVLGEQLLRNLYTSALL